MTQVNLTRRGALFGGLALAACTTAEQQAIFDQVLGSTGGAAGVGISQAQAAEGIRAALNNGVTAAVATVSRDGGYFNDPQIRIPLPGVLADVQSNLSPLGLSRLLDQAELELNRAAETAAPEARDIFVDAITAMTIDDAIGIVRGSNTSATEYLQRTSTARLTRLFTPPMEDAVRAVGLTSTLNELDSRLRIVPSAPSLGAAAQQEVVDHGVEYALDGLFYYVGREEAAIRANPAKRTSEILRAVFG